MLKAFVLYVFIKSKRESIKIMKKAIFGFFKVVLNMAALFGILHNSQ